MTDREKAMLWLNSFVKNKEPMTLIPKQLIRLIHDVLKEQEAVKPYVTGRGESFETAETWWYACGNCHEALDPDDKYCRHCGRQVKWDD